MSALVFHYDPTKWTPSGRAPNAWPYSANAHKVHAATHAGTDFVLFNMVTKMAVAMGQIVRPVNIAGSVGWQECDEDWEAAGWKTCPIPLSKTFGTKGNWIPWKAHRVDFLMPALALRERLEGKLYRRNPVVISDRAFAKVKEAALA